MHWHPRWKNTLASRDRTVSEILDGDLAAFDRVRPPFARTTIEEAQRRIVEGIGLAEHRSGGQLALADLIIEVASKRLESRGSTGQSMRVLDAAAGSGWLARTLWKRARDKGLSVKIGANDLDPALVRSLRERFSMEGIPSTAKVVDARHMAGVATGSWDVAVLSHTLHHFSRRDAIWCLRELDRVSGGGALVFDIDRSLLGLISIPAVVSLLAPRCFPYCARDGIASVRRAFTVSELERLLDDAGLRWKYRVGPLPTPHPQRWITNAILPA